MVRQIMLLTSLLILSASLLTAEPPVDEAQQAELAKAIAMDARVAFVKHVDNYFSLNENQRDRLAKRLETDITPEQMLDFLDEIGGLDGSIEVFSDGPFAGPVKAVLTPDQRRLMDLLVGTEWSFADVMNGEAEDATKSFNKIASTLVELRLSQIKKCVQPTKSQSAKLDMVAKMAVRSAARELVEVCKAAADDDESLELMTYMFRPILCNCVAQPIWSKTLNQILTPEQKKRLASYDQWRREATKTRASVTCIVCCGIEFAHTIESYQSIMKIFRKHVSVDDGDCYRGMLQAILIDKKILKTAFKNEQHWQEIEPEFVSIQDDIRQMQD